MDYKNNKPLEQIEQLERESVQKSVPDIAEGSESEDEYIKLKRGKEQIKEIKIIREERKKYAIKTFRFLWIYISTVIAIMLADGLVAVCYGKDLLDVISLATLIGTIPASMALFGWVLKGLFPMDKNK